MGVWQRAGPMQVFGKGGTNRKERSGGQSGSRSGQGGKGKFMD